MSSTDHLTSDQLRRALDLRDLTDPAQGPHAIQTLLDGVVAAMHAAWGCTVRTVRNPPIVPVRENYDRLGYDPADVTRARRYTRYISPTVMLRSHTSAELPRALDDYADRTAVDELIVVPGLVYRRDVVDRHHVGEPHQVDLWRLRSTPDTSDDDLRAMIGTLVDAVLPGAEWRATAATHPYTVGGRQIDVRHDGEWLELAECGRIHPDVLRRSGLDPNRWSGLALGMGLERAVMLRKAIPDIRYLRAADPRIAQQMVTLDPWRHVSPLPAATRDLPSSSRARRMRKRSATASARRSVRTRISSSPSRYAPARPHETLPDAARTRLATRPGQANVLLRVVLRPIDRTLTSDEANALRNAIYRAVHEGPVMELI